MHIARYVGSYVCMYVTSTLTSKGIIRHKYTKAKQKHAYYIVMSGDS